MSSACLYILFFFLPEAKYEEKEINTPPLSYFCEHSTSLFSDIDEILLYERNIVEAFHLIFSSILDCVGTLVRSLLLTMQSFSKRSESSFRMTLVMITRSGTPLDAM